MNFFSLTKVWTAVLFIVSTIMTVLSLIQTSHVIGYQLPIPTAVAVLCSCAPIINLFSQVVGHWYLKLYSNDFSSHAVNLLNLAYVGIATLAFDVVLATMTAEKLPLQAALLQEEWKHMFSAKSLKIKTIQQSFECCGLMSIKDRGYPFPDAQHKSDACIEKYGFTQPCLPALERATHKAALIFFLTLIIAIITKVGFTYFLVWFELKKARVQGYLDEQPWTENTPLLGDHETSAVGDGTRSTGIGNESMMESLE